MSATGSGEAIVTDPDLIDCFAPYYRPFSAPGRLTKSSRSIAPRRMSFGRAILGSCRDWKGAKKDARYSAVGHFGYNHQL